MEINEFNELNVSKVDIYDDDMYIDDCKSIKRRLTILEKILIIVTAFLSMPISVFILYVANNVSPFESLSNTLIFTFIWLISFLVLGFSEFAVKNISQYKGLLQSTIVSTFFSGLIFLAATSLISYFDKYHTYSWLGFALIAFGVYFVVILAIRVIEILIDSRVVKCALIIGPKDEAEMLARRLISEERKNFKVRYVFYEINGEISDYIYTKFHNANQIILMDTLTAKNKEKFLLFFNSCLNKDVYLCTSYFDIVLTSPSTQNIGDILSFEQKPLKIDVVEAFAKRIVDILISAVFLILSLPIWIVVPLAIKLYDHGPVFYSQIRLTKDLKEFRILKFRSMKVDAEKIGGAQLATAHDSRITPIGKFIRATRIDEIPQILNIFKGDMSFVGPRPERPEFVKDFLKENDLYKYRYNVKAGLTGWQQVKCTYHTDFNDKLRYDLNYITNYSLALDFYIILLTVKVCLSKGMAEGITKDNLTLYEFLKAFGKEYNQHETFLRILNHKRKIDDKTGFIIPLGSEKKIKEKIDKANKIIDKVSKKEI